MCGKWRSGLGLRDGNKCPSGWEWEQVSHSGSDGNKCPTAAANAPNSHTPPPPLHAPAAASRARAAPPVRAVTAGNGWRRTLVSALEPDLTTT